MRNTHRDFGKFNRPNVYYPLYVSENGRISIFADSEYSIVVYPNWNDGFEGCWTWEPGKAKENITLLTAKKVDGAWKIYRKAYALLDGVEVKKQVKSIWNDTAFYTEKGQKVLNELFETKEKLFQAPKSCEMLKQTLLMAQTGNNDNILDFFSGSATTAHAVMQLNAEDGGNRRFILVQLPEVCDEKSEAAKAGYANICEIGKERIRRAGANIGAGDTGFRVFKLDSSNLKTWDAAPIGPQAGDVIGELANRMNAMIHRVKPDRSDLDMVFEVMLKLGVPLDFPVAEVSVNGKTAYSVGEDCLLLVCLTPDIQPEDMEQMAEYAPAKAVISRDSFADDTAMANAWYILRDRGVDLKLV